MATKPLEGEVLPKEQDEGEDGESLVKRALALPGTSTNVSLPEHYERAIVAIQECQRLEDAQHWNNRMEAVSVLAKQLRDGKLIEMARRLRANTMRRLGQLLEEEAEPKERRMRAQRAGVSKGQQLAAERIARISELTFKAVVEQPGSCSQSNLLQIEHAQRMASRPSAQARQGETMALKREAVRQLTDDKFFRRHHPNTVARLFGADRESIIQAATTRLKWLESFIRTLRQ